MLILACWPALGETGGPVTEKGRVGMHGRQEKLWFTDKS